MRKLFVPIGVLAVFLALALPVVFASFISQNPVEASHLSTPCNQDLGLEVSKEAEGPDSRTIISGSQVTFTITVENPCDLNLEQITVSDPLTPECDQAIPPLQGIFNRPNPVASPVSSFTYQCTTTQGVTAGFTNIATATGIMAGSNDPVDVVTDSDPSTVVIQADFCEDKVKPSVLTMQLAGGGAGDSNHSQDAGKVTVSGSDVNSGPVYVISSDKEDPTNSKAKIWFAGSVNIGDSFDISAVGVGKDDRLKGETRVFIYDADPSSGGSLIQTIGLHTSCSQPLNSGDQYGAVVLVGFVGV